MFNSIWHRTSSGELGAPAGAAVVVSVLGAELGAGVGEAAHPAGRATEVLSVKAALNMDKKKNFYLCPKLVSNVGYQKRFLLLPNLQEKRKKQKKSQDSVNV